MIHTYLLLFDFPHRESSCVERITAVSGNKTQYNTEAGNLYRFTKAGVCAAVYTTVVSILPAIRTDSSTHTNLADDYVIRFKSHNSWNSH